MTVMAKPGTGGLVLVFGATGQQGGSVAAALRAAGRPVRVFVRDAAGPTARALAASGAELATGNLADASSVQAAMAGVQGVFSVQPSSGQGAAYGVSDAEEIRYGVTVADAAKAAGVGHFVYSSANAAGPEPTGMGHFDSKAAIERHLATLDMTTTVLRPSAFMEILMLPGLGLDEGRLTFFMRPDQPMQIIAAADIGRLATAVLADPARFGGRTLEIAGDEVTGNRMAAALSKAAGRPITYQRFPEGMLENNGFLRHLMSLVDDGRLAGNADLAALRDLVPDLLTFDQWLDGAGGALLSQAIMAKPGDVALR